MRVRPVDEHVAERAREDRDGDEQDEIAPARRREIWPVTRLAVSITNPATVVMPITYSHAPTSARKRLDARKYAVNAKRLTEASTSPRSSTPRVRRAEHDHDRAGERDQRPADRARGHALAEEPARRASSTSAGWSAPMRLTLTTLVSFKLVK